MQTVGAIPTSLPELTPHPHIAISTCNTEKEREDEATTETTLTKCDTPKSRKPTTTRESGIKCEICKHKFINSSNLKKHNEKYHKSNEHNSANSFKRNQCNITFKEKNKVTNHMNKHHSSCTICQRTFSTTEELKTHNTEAHKHGNPKNKIEREPSLANHKMKKIN